MFARGYGDITSKSVVGRDANLKRTWKYSQRLLEVISPYPPARTYSESKDNLENSFVPIRDHAGMVNESSSATKRESGLFQSAQTDYYNAFIRPAGKTGLTEKITDE